MDKIENTEKKDNFRLLSVFIDNIVQERQIFYQQSERCCECYELVFVKSGALQLAVNGKRMKLKKNTASIIKKGSKMIFYRVSDEDCMVTTIGFDGSGVPGMLRYLELKERDVLQASGNAVAVLLDSIIQYYEGGEYFRAALALQTMLITAKDAAQKNYRVSNLNGIYEYIQTHYGEPLDLNHLAGVYGTSVSYFSRAFRQFFGVTPMAFVNEVRIRQARMLLETTDLKIHEIAERCGFEKLEYFCYVFKKSEGCTPTQYRLNRGYASK